MKKLLAILLALLLFTGCAAKPAETTVPQTTAAPTEPPVPWIQELAMPWDEDGALVELPLTIPDGLHYGSGFVYGDDLLLWSIDDHRGDIRATELCVVDLDTGTVIGQDQFDFKYSVTPQILGDSIFLCDSLGGKVLELNRQLEVINSWETEPIDANLHMGADEKLYIYRWSGSLLVQDLKTGETTPVLEEGTYVDFFTPEGNGLVFTYFDPITGEEKYAVVDLLTGVVQEPEIQKDFSHVEWAEGTWLCEVYREGSVFYVTDETGTFRRVDMDYDTLRLVDDRTLLRTWDDGCHISLHDLTGKTISSAMLTGSPYSISCFEVIPSQTYGGYFLLTGDYGTSLRLLYWDITKSVEGKDVLFQPIPEPGEAEAQIRQKIDELKQTYGLNILVGEECQTVFYDFDAQIVIDWEVIQDALNTLESALVVYPENFFPQLRYDTYRSVDIYLVGPITPTNPEYVDTYSAFVQEEYDRHVMVVDMYMSDRDTYFHEFSHIIDSFLEWDSWNREDALFSEDSWIALNPDWFPGYSYDYSWEQYVEDYTCFIDSYSTIRPTEDRARVLEYGMSEYGAWAFEDATVLQAKLEYYCRCIRDAFDTTGWPETVIWEQYLP